MKVGTEHEFSINDVDFKPLSINDVLIEKISGKVQNEVSLGEVSISKELQKHVLEFKPDQPSYNLISMGKKIYEGILKISTTFGNRYKFLGTGVHPLLKLEDTSYWEHGEEGCIYKEYDRVFGIRQHGFMNIQALQINIPYKNDDDMVVLYNKIRSLLPFLIALTSASPFVEGRCTGIMDNRLIYYKENQKRIPLICNNLLSDRLKTMNDYRNMLEEIYKSLKKEGANILCKEWIASMGAIVRFSRKCIEIKALDEQDSMYSDMAVVAFLLSLLKGIKGEYVDDDNTLSDMTEKAIKFGTIKLKAELEDIYKIAWKNTDNRYLKYLLLIKRRIDEGSLAEILTCKSVKENVPLPHLLNNLHNCLMDNRPYTLYENKKIDEGGSHGV